jgi:hypothetical protein
MDSHVESITVDFVPVEYSHLPEEAFPKEDARRFTSQLGSKVAGFEQEVTDIKGGREYEVRATSKDARGNVATATLTTPYVREFENLGKLVYDKGLVAIADYYTWYESPGKPNAAWGSQGTPHAHVYNPLLGEYSSSDPIVIAKHIDWATGHGINTFAVHWCGDTSTDPNTPGTDPNSLPKFEGTFLKHPMLEQLHFFILYENNNRLKIRNPDDPSEKWIEDLDDPFNRGRLVSDFAYLTRYFTDSSYLKIDDKPAVIFDYMACFRGDVKGVFRQLRDSIKASGASDPYLINDLGLRAHDPKEIVNPSHPHIQQIVEETDAIGYGMPDCYVCPDLEEKYRLWHAAAIQYKKDYLPYSMPGLEPGPGISIPGTVPVPRKPETFRKQIVFSMKHSTRRMIGIKAFNEWYWGHQIEPATEYGLAYLEIVRDCVGEGLS